MADSHKESSSKARGAEEIVFMAMLKKMDRDGGWGVDEGGI